MNSLELELNHQQKKKKNSLEAEVELVKLKEKIKETQEKENSQFSYLTGTITGLIISTGLAVFFWYKRIFDEYWYYGSGAFGAMALISLILIPFAYKWFKEAEKKTKELKKRLKDYSI